MALPTDSLSPVNDDDEIIELTDIVEKGSVPEGTGHDRGTPNSLESQMADLLNSANGGLDEVESFDLDSLLDDSVPEPNEDVKVDSGNGQTVDFDVPDTLTDMPSAPEAGSIPAKGDAALTDDGLDMSDLGEVDALLRDMLPPEQPVSRLENSEVSASARTGTAVMSAVSAVTEENGEEVEVEDLDALLASLDDMSAAKPSEPAAAKDEVEDLDALLDSIMNPVAEKTTASDEVMSVFDEVAEAEAALSGEIDAAVSTFAEAGEDEAELPSDELSPASDGESDAEVDLDALLNSAQAEMEAHREVTGQLEEENPLEDLDALLADLNEESAPPAEVSPEEREEAMSALAEALGGSASSDSSEADMTDMVTATSEAAEDGMDFAAALAAELAGQESREPVEAEVPVSAAADEQNPASRAGLDGSLDDLDALLSNIADSKVGADMITGADRMEEFPLESDLGDPLLVGEPQLLDDAGDGGADLGAAVLQSLEALAADIVGLQSRMENFSAAGPDFASFDDLRTRVESLQAEVRDMAENHASGLAVAEARISALEAELAERGAGDDDRAARIEERTASLEISLLARIEALEANAVTRAETDDDSDKPDYAGDIARLLDRMEAMELNGSSARFEDRVQALESGVDKAAAEAAARVIREEIAALLSDMTGESGRE